MSKKMRKFIASGLICILGLSMVACGDNKAETSTQVEQTAEAGEDASKDATSTPAVDPNAVIAKVGDTEILRSELDLQLGYQQMMMMMYYGEEFLDSEQGKVAVQELKMQIADKLIEWEIDMQKAEELGQTATEEAILEAFESQKSGYTSEEEFKTALEESHMTEEDLKAEIKKSLTVQNIESYITKDATVTDAEVEEYYDANVANYTQFAGANVYHILVKTEEDARKVKAEYDAGKSFEELVTQYSVDESSKDMQGSLGYMNYSEPNVAEDYKIFVEEVKKLGEGEVSDPIETKDGWHIAKADGVTPEDIVTPLADIKETVQNDALVALKAVLIAEQIEAWKEEIKVEKFDDLING